MIDVKKLLETAKVVLTALAACIGAILGTI